MNRQTSRSGFGLWLDDRRFAFNDTPRRIRENISHILNDLNQQLMHQNPELISQLSEQLHRLNDVLNGRTVVVTTPAAARGNNPQHNSAPATTSHQPRLTTRHSTSIVENSQLSSSLSTQDINAADADTASYDEAIRRGPSRRYTDSSLDRMAAASVQTTTSPANQAQPSTTVVNIDLDAQLANRQNLGNPSAGDAESQSVAGADARPSDSNSGAMASAEASIIRDENGAVTVVQQPGSNNNTEWRSLVDLSRNAEIQRLLKYAYFFVPFLIILSCRAIFVHTKEFSALMVSAAIFIHADGFITKQVAAKGEAKKGKLIGFSVVFIVQLYVIYHVQYGDDGSGRLLYFFAPNTLLENDGRDIRISTVLWYVVVTDFAAKTLAMLAKCQVILFPTKCLPLKKKPVCYQWIEYIGQVYRWYLPIIPWYYYLIAPIYPSVFRHFLATFYVALKMIFSAGKIRSWWTCSKILSRPMPFGKTPCESDVLQCGPQCSICHGSFENPIQLDCKHIFCEDCISTWLDKEKTCPICRAQVNGEDRTWRDGSTSMAIQIC